LIPAFAVGRTQEILYLLAQNFKQWELDRWHIFLDSPMAIEATRIFTQNTDLFDKEAIELWRENSKNPLLPNLRISRTPTQSMAINRIQRGAIIIAGSGMCTGGRIRHHLKHNIWRRECQLVITGFQARGTTGRALVDGAAHIRLWGEEIRVAAKVHTIGGLSAHADQLALKNWYANFNGRPPVTLVHGEERAITGLSDCLRRELSAPVHVAQPGELLELA
jgi:metallo-beta-lactamase family protein